MNVIKIIAVLCLILTSAKLYAQTEGQRRLAKEVLEHVNGHRVSKGLPALRFNDNINGEAYEHSRNMARKRVPFGHDGFDDRYKRLVKKIANVRHVAENVAYGNVNAGRIFDMWLHSKGHKKNMEGDFNLAGVGVAESRDGYLYVTMIFVKQK